MLTAILVTAIVAVLASAFAGREGIARLVHLRTERNDLLAASVTRMAENERLLDAVQGLRHDPRQLEAVARKELGLVRPDEVVYRFPRQAR